MTCKLLLPEKTTYGILKCVNGSGPVVLQPIGPTTLTLTLTLSLTLTLTLTLP